MKVIAFSGSLRAESFTTKLLKAFQSQAPAGVSMEIADISQLPFINQDLEAAMPQPVKDLHTIIGSADAVLFATPEYNRSYSPVLKNAIDWGSRPQGNNAWDGLPAGILGCTPYNLGAFGAVHHLRQVLVYINMPAMQQPEFYLAGAGDKFAADGTLTDGPTKQMIDKYWTAFVAWAEKNQH